MTPPVERVQKLLKLVADRPPESEEARTAAEAACRLIIKHGLFVVETMAQPTPEPVRDWRPPAAKKTRKKKEPKPEEAPCEPTRADKPVFETLQNGSFKDVIAEAAQEAASRITIGDVASLFMRGIRR